VANTYITETNPQLFFNESITMKENIKVETFFKYKN